MSEKDDDDRDNEDEIISIRIGIRARYRQIHDLNRRLIELGEAPEDE
jgi:hypothetical protein